MEIVSRFKGADSFQQGTALVVKGGVAHIGIDGTKVHCLKDGGLRSTGTDAVLWCKDGTGSVIHKGTVQVVVDEPVEVCGNVYVDGSGRIYAKAGAGRTEITNVKFITLGLSPWVEIDAGGYKVPAPNFCMPLESDIQAYYNDSP